MTDAHLSRYAEIAGALARHGLGFLVSKLALERHVPFHRGLLGHPPREEPYTRPDHLRMALEPGGRFGLIDFGLVGTLDARQRAALAAGLLAAAARDSRCRMIPRSSNTSTRRSASIGPC